jgi:hypothetical protein
MARDDTFQHLRIFEDVVSLVRPTTSKKLDVRQAMRGAMKGLADGLDPDSAYSHRNLPAAETAPVPVRLTSASISFANRISASSARTVRRQPKQD